MRRNFADADLARLENAFVVMDMSTLEKIVTLDLG